MKWMGWSYEQLESAPQEVVDTVLELMQEEYDAYRDAANSK